MIPDWAWALVGGTAIGLCGFWCRSVLGSLQNIQKSMLQSEVSLSNINAQLAGLHGRVGRLEDSQDRNGERRLK